MDIQSLFPIGHEFKSLIVFNPKATDPRKKLGFDPQFIPQSMRPRYKPYFRDYEDEEYFNGADDYPESHLGISSSPEKYMVIFRIENVGAHQLSLGEEWRAKVVGVFPTPNSRTTDGRIRCPVYVELIGRVEEITPWIYQQDSWKDPLKGSVIRTTSSGRVQILVEKKPAIIKPARYRLADGRIVLVDEIKSNDGTVTQYRNYSIRDANVYLNQLLKDNSNFKTESLQRLVKNMSPVPETLLQDQSFRLIATPKSELGINW